MTRARDIDLSHAVRTPRRSRRAGIAAWAALCVAAGVVAALVGGPAAAFNTVLVAGVILPGALFLISNL